MNGGFTAPSMWATAEAEAVAEVAEYMQEQLDGECWPVCPEHDRGLHPEVRGGDAVWQCRFGDHTVAVIGSLGRGSRQV